ncbi:DUF397 domain-containing protein [Actinoalloteichus caeruleus]|uniref:DUF397 domain-containing protein n=1 Tax=Actinoalloteichus cyanogriseus TaxID=2893586 RepID=UPI003AAF9112
MAAEPTMTNWRKSNHSSSANGGCVEIGGAPGLVGIRDTKNRAGGTLVVSREAFSSFLMSVKAERL